MYEANILGHCELLRIFCLLPSPAFTSATSARAWGAGLCGGVGVWREEEQEQMVVVVVEEEFVVVVVVEEEEEEEEEDEDEDEDEEED